MGVDSGTLLFLTANRTDEQLGSRCSGPAWRGLPLAGPMTRTARTPQRPADTITPGSGNAYLQHRPGMGNPYLPPSLPVEISQ